MVEAFPEDTAPRYLLRDRDKIYGCDFRQRIQGMNIEEVLSAPASPWQGPTWRGWSDPSGANAWIM